MDRAALPRELRPVMDDQGRLTQWPAKQKVQRMAVEYPAGRFEQGRECTEQEVNERLLDWLPRLGHPSAGCSATGAT